MNYTPWQVLVTISLGLAFLLLYIWSAYNSMIRRRNQVKTDFSDIDIQLKRRSSLIQNLVDLVKDYARHEKETFENVAKARAAVDTSKTAGESARADNMLTQTLRSLFMVVENYPKLQASDNYKQLREDLVDTENLIAMYREDYNRSVQRYNNLIQTFPNLFVAQLFKFYEEEFFTATV
ncbi:MAG: LemA family protein [Candidatus Gottesmanbacteria bacterium GW2011_GWB1_43_11]|uniref:LemA family protein n=1 Tax=Candidatus Gottesmanbacteria bacterium GW2011_GWB1_43_11 TaxID=1618446 RepID=A0A0G1CJ35_9BACT|nr:MAG: LemA family protein [Candidatus Gottesmanbacteria bacterium GW2011_GWA2_42_16]KKS85507.1 MAG: LemA family protein [Candidatus Gottesmanbacteria bacterium GW2011_GWB1_43_11]OGG10668.1 MAG: hypothetical protein A2699_02595 [Candidatus Gottesmanbacteria bacterium RIFCSPHIGHO2_01_FULL_43_15]OGG27388.1 MAG: hypothetical protein A3A59_06015 [Candidatus Gottesmanbacteria bacterium RIFCSPLOWO2_01_FULL_42_10]HCM38199.1 hypothetical protein [Patescibacteria group bacterium]